MPHSFARHRQDRGLLRRHAGRRYCAWLALSCFTLMIPQLVLSAPSGRIQGQVQQEGNAIANHRIMLIRFGPGQEVNRTPGQTDADGGFSFDALETGADFTYFVGIRYEGQLFRSESMQLADDETKSDVLVQVGAAGTPALGPTPAPGPTPGPGGQEAQPDRVHIAHHVMAIVLRENRLDVREIVTLQNPGSTPYRGEGQGSYVFHLPLPKDYDNLREIQGLDQKHIRSDPFGIYYTAPLAPGAHRLVYTYALPMTDRVRTLLVRHGLPTQLADVFVDASHLVASSDFQFMGQVPIESHTFLHFRGTNPEPGSRNWVQVTRLAESVGNLIRVISYVLIVAIALLGVAIPLYNRWRQAALQVSSAPTAEQIQQWQTERSQLLLAIAQLDNTHESGELDEPVYRQRRQSYKQQLRRVAEELHRANDPLGTPILAAPKGSE